MTNVPEIGKKIFEQGQNMREYAFFGCNNVEDQFFSYAYGYKQSADLILNHALKTGHPDKLDSYVFPACFLYRQYIELTLKDFYLRNSPDSEEIKQQTLIKCQHNLIDIWETFKDTINDDLKDYIINFFNNAAIIDAAEDYIKQFNDEDRNSFAFRYPITKKLELIHVNRRIINLQNLLERMKELENFFDGIKEVIYLYISLINEDYYF
ncbi:MAG: hypothetical protein LBS60_07060 [Deltaproteobacteria bacterium]|jgi:hypothetical protein|nr:hypothetical protein [Deltaproteobacteria bacterium]